MANASTDANISFLTVTSIGSIVNNADAGRLVPFPPQRLYGPYERPATVRQAGFSRIIFKPHGFRQERRQKGFRVVLQQFGEASAGDGEQIFRLDAAFFAETCSDRRRLRSGRRYPPVNKAIGLSITPNLRGRGGFLREAQFGLWFLRGLAALLAATRRACLQSISRTADMTVRALSRREQSFDSPGRTTLSVSTNHPILAAFVASGATGPIALALRHGS